MFVAIDLDARRNDHVLGHSQTAQTTMSPLRTADGWLIALAHDDHEIHIAVFGGLAPCVRTEQPDLFRLKFRHQPLCGCFKQIGVERFHGFERESTVRSGAMGFKFPDGRLCEGTPAHGAGSSGIRLSPRPAETGSRRRHNSRTVCSIPSNLPVETWSRETGTLTLTQW